MTATIYRPCKTAMQSGRQGTAQWVLEHDRQSARTVDRLMGWTSSADTRQQVRLTFASKERAIEFAERHDLAYRVIDPQEPKIRLKSYADNFRFDRP